MDPYSITPIFAVGMIFAFLDAYGIGANDVANSFATAVGSRSLSLMQACIIALFTEFLGAILLGAETVETIKSKIIDVNDYKSVPDVLALTFLCALVGSSFWVISASKFGWPVSTTHSIVGAIAGAGIGAYGAGGVVWGWEGMGKIIASWFISPTVAGIVASIIFMLTKYLVLENANAFKRALKAMPVYVFVTFSILLFYVINKAPKGIDLSKKDSKTGAFVNSGKVGLVLGITFGISAFLAIWTYIFAVPFFDRRIDGEEDLKWYHMFYIHWVPKQKHAEFIPIDAGAVKDETRKSDETTVEVRDTDVIGDRSDKKYPEETPSLWGRVQAYLLRGIRMDVASHQGDSRIKATHDLAPKYCNKTEYLYSFLQIATSAFASFAHGSNDVANAVGPIAAIYSIWQTGQVPGSKTTVPVWILAYGGIAIDMGLFFFGFSVMRNLGNNMTYHSPARGFSMELGAALTVITASFLGIPVSTTHCITGATVAVGLCNGNLKTINWKMVAWTLFSWLLTLPVVGIIAGVLNHVLLYSPKL
jgi:sodium-dependent phosphate transporter